MLTVSVIVPLYRAEQTLPELYRQLAAAMAEITPVFEIIFVEDGAATVPGRLSPVWRARTTGCGAFG